MKIKNKTSFDVVVQAWLEAEWSLPERNTIRNNYPESLIHGKDFENIQKNQQRLALLHSWRSPVIDPLPNDTIWYSATFDREDIGRTSIVISNDWERVSGSTYLPLKIMENLHLDDGHAHKINAILAELPQNTVDKRLVFIGSDINSLLTIIEGNHRGVAIFKDALERNLQNPIIEEVFLGISSQMKDYIFHREHYMTS